MDLNEMRKKYLQNKLERETFCEDNHRIEKDLALYLEDRYNDQIDNL